MKFRNLAISLVIIFILVLTTPVVSLSEAIEETADSYAVVLSMYVDDDGLVDYAGLKENRGELDSFIKLLAKQSSTTYQNWSRDKKIAFWINAYNALTLRSIIDNYPIKWSFQKILFPKNSIRQIKGVWKEKKHRVMSRNLTLDQIEHEILRKEFQEPRVHVALVCAAVSCPSLRNEPYRANKLALQFKQQAQRFLSNAHGMQLPKPGDKTLRVSKIFKWFAEDFLWLYSDETNPEVAVIRYIAANAPEGIDKSVFQGGRLSYLDYNWELNEQGLSRKRQAYEQNRSN